MQLLKLVEQFYATLLLQDDKVTSNHMHRAEKTRDDSEESEGPLSLQVVCPNSYTHFKLYNYSHCIQESLFEFLNQHYTVKVLAPISCHSFISSLEEYSSNCRVSFTMPFAIGP